jgi:LacI family transcriptional regulator
VINLDNCDVTEEATLELIARHADLRGLCVVGGGGDGIIRALSQLPKRPSLCCILQESTELSRQALDQGLIDLVIDSQPRLLAAALVDLLVELQTTPDFDPLRHRVHIPLQIITSENARGCVRW